MGRAGETGILLDRLGLGARPGDRRRFAGDPRGVALAELSSPDVLALSDRRLASGAGVYRALSIKEAARRSERGNPVPSGQGVLIEEGRRTDLGCARRGGAPADAPPSSEACEALALRSAGPPNRRYAPERAAYVWETSARFEKARTCEIGFAERLVAFWANHFAVSGAKGYFIQGLAGAFEREAIRPHVFGRFGDMLLAATRHPAMLWYLDNRTSVGPNSSTGRRREAGLNENHARELLELHTLGVDGGYAQADVTSLALALTGWVVMDDATNPGFGRFHFAGARHEPGERTVLGRRYAASGAAQGERALADVAARPETASHVARKLAAAFVSEEPPPTLVAKLAATFRDTGGDLAEVARALASADETWRPAASRYRTPQDFVFATLRLLGARQDAGTLIKGLETLGQPLWRPPSPEGYSYRGGDWLSPSGHLARLNLAQTIATANAAVDPVERARETFGDALSDETLTAVGRAETRQQGLTLLLMSPEMQWR
jgi:uncharacterized protein (DUF1800 family)